MQPQQMGSKRSMIRSAAPFFTVAFLASMAGGAMAFLGSDLLGSPLFSQNSGTESNWRSPLAFDAPTWELARIKAGEKELNRSFAVISTEVASDVTLLDDWQYTLITRGRPTPSNRK